MDAFGCVSAKSSATDVFELHRFLFLLFNGGTVKDVAIIRRPQGFVAAYLRTVEEGPMRGWP